MPFAPRLTAYAASHDAGDDLDLLGGFAPTCPHCLAMTTPESGRRGVWWRCLECALPQIG